MSRPNDPFWEYVEKMDGGGGGGMKCTFCDHFFFRKYFHYEDQMAFGKSEKARC